MKKIYFLFLPLFITLGVCGQYSLMGTTYTQNFDGLGTASSVVINGNLSNISSSLNGWYFAEVGSNINNTIVTAGNGSSPTGDTYNFGLTANADRTLGALQTTSITPTFGFYFTNNTGITITTLEITYTGETWRVGNPSRSDRLDFQYSADAANVNATANWIDVNTLDYSNPGQAAGSGTVQHSATVTNLFTGLNIPVGSTFFIRWTSNQVGVNTDDGLGIDDFSLTASAPVSTQFYSKSTGNLTDLSSWGTNTNGTGTAPLNFTGNFQNFNISNRATTTLNANWTVSGVGSKVIAGNGITATALTIPVNAILAGVIDVTNLSTLILQNNNLPTLGTLATNSSVSYEQTGNFLVPPGSYANLILKGGTKQLGAIGIASIINGNLTLDGVTDFEAGDVRLSGNFTLLNNSTFRVGLTDMLLTMTGSGTQTLSGGDFRLNLLQTPVTPSTTVNIALGSNTNLFLGSLNNGGDNGLFLPLATHTLSLNGNTLTLVNAGTFGTGLGSITGSSTSNIVIDLSNVFGLGTLRFTPGAQLLSTLNIISTDGQALELGSALSIGINLNFENGNGVISTTNTNLLTILENATITGSSTTGNIDGPLARITNVADEYLFPLLPKPFTLQILTGGNVSTFKGQYFPTNANFASPCVINNATEYTSYKTDEYWDIVRTSGTSQARVILTFDGDLQNAEWQNGTAPDNVSTALIVVHYNATNNCWEKATGYPQALFPPYNMGTSTVNSDIWNSFSPFTLGYFNFGAALPVKFGNVKAYQQGNGVKIDWSNFTESDLVNYKVERSAVGQTFTPLSTVNPTLNNGGRADYSHFDPSPINGINFYRIQSLETNGKKLYSVIVKVDTKDGNIKATIYPNPVTDGQLVLQTPDLKRGIYAVTVFNAVGQQVYRKPINHSGGFVTQSIQLPASLKTGIYNLQLIGDGVKITKTFTLQ